MENILKGLHEKVNYSNGSRFILYPNVQRENIAKHWHSSIEFILALKNNYQVCCNGILFCLKEGDILLITPGVIHDLHSPEEGECIIFQADFSILSMMRELETAILHLAPAVVITAETSPEIRDEIWNLFLAIHIIYFSSTTYKQTMIQSKILEVLAMIGNNFSKAAENICNKTKKQKEYAEKFLFICDYINNHCTEDLTLNFMADMAGFSKYHFSRLFKQFTNVSFYRYLNNKRMLLAEELLVSPGISVSEVAIRCGFNSFSAFSRMFKAWNSCTPTEFRLMNRL